MITYEEALTLILAEVRLLPTESVALRELNGRVLAGPTVSTVDLPPFDNSAVDGYAVRTPVEGPLRLVGEMAAGAAQALHVNPGEAVRIFTGAPLPTGADAVVMQEDVHRHGDQVSVQEAVAAGDHIRRRGEEVRMGDTVLQSGCVVTPAVVGVLATLGIARPGVYRRARITLVETGNELADPGQPLPPGSVYAANGVALASAAEALGATVLVRRVGDDAEELRHVFSTALEQSDVVITSGGVSVGDHDLVRPTWESLGVHTRFWRVAIKPGKPVFFGTAVGGPLIFGLPGNPVSALVTFYLFVRPAMLAMCGLRDPEPVMVEAGADFRGSDNRDEFVRVVIEGDVATPLEKQGSHMASGLALANGLVRLPAGAVRVPKGEAVSALRLDWGLGAAVSGLSRAGRETQVDVSQRRKGEETFSGPSP